MTRCGQTIEFNEHCGVAPATSVSARRDFGEQYDDRSARHPNHLRGDFHFILHRSEKAADREPMMLDAFD